MGLSAASHLHAVSATEQTRMLQNSNEKKGVERCFLLNTEFMLGEGCRVISGGS